MSTSKDKYLIVGYHSKQNDQPAFIFRDGWTMDRSQANEYEDEYEAQGLIGPLLGGGVIISIGVIKALDFDNKQITQDEAYGIFYAVFQYGVSRSTETEFPADTARLLHRLVDVYDLKVARVVPEIPYKRLIPERDRHVFEI